jgi:hypothetical protein
MVEAARLPSPKRLRGHTYKIHIGLLSTSRLRPGEVLTLARPDVDLQSGILLKITKVCFTIMTGNCSIRIGGTVPKRTNLAGK